MNTASGAWRRAASSRLSVPTAFTSKSSNGRDAARSWLGWAAAWMTSSKRAAPQQRVDRRPVADVEVVVRVALAGGLEALAVPRRVAAGPEEVGPHVVVDAVHVEAEAVEELHRLGADEPGAAGDEDLHARRPDAGDREDMARDTTGCHADYGQSMRVAVTLEQCWHRVPGGTARATLDTVERRSARLAATSSRWASRLHRAARRLAPEHVGRPAALLLARPRRLGGRSRQRGLGSRRRGRSTSARSTGARRRSASTSPRVARCADRASSPTSGLRRASSSTTRTSTSPPGPQRWRTWSTCTVVHHARLDGIDLPACTVLAGAQPLWWLSAMAPSRWRRACCLGSPGEHPIRSEATAIRDGRRGALVLHGATTASGGHAAARAGALDRALTGQTAVHDRRYWAGTSATGRARPPPDGTGRQLGPGCVEGGPALDQGDASPAARAAAVARYSALPPWSVATTGRPSSSPRAATVPPRPQAASRRRRTVASLHRVHVTEQVHAPASSGCAVARGVGVGRLGGQAAARQLARRSGSRAIASSSTICPFHPPGALPTPRRADRGPPVAPARPATPRRWRGPRRWGAALAGDEPWPPTRRPPARARGRRRGRGSRTGAGLTRSRHRAPARSTGWRVGPGGRPGGPGAS